MAQMHEMKTSIDDLKALFTNFLKCQFKELQVDVATMKEDIKKSKPPEIVEFNLGQYNDFVREGLPKQFDKCILSWSFLQEIW